MLTPIHVPPLTREQFEQQSRDLAAQFYQVLQGRALNSGVVLQALMDMHCYITTHLTQQERTSLSVAMAAYAGELLDGSTFQATPHTTH